ncbi:MAG: tyrosine-type recombinase/integrase [Planctomycetes bacterium]|nr:tyrosine-type recombinase/integrase [Planctomycetota bacterium]
MKIDLAISKYLDLIKIQGCTSDTLANQKLRVNHCFDYLKTLGFSEVEDVTLKELNGYQVHLYYYITRYGKPMAIESQISYLSAVLSFYKTLTKARVLINNPAIDLDFPRRVKKLPAHSYSSNDLRKIYSGIDTDSIYGFQFRTMLEVFSSTGIRSGELCSLRLKNLELDDGFVFIKEGKGLKDRRLPIGKTAIAYLKGFLNDVRIHLVKPVTGDHVFVTKSGRMFDRYSISKKIPSLGKKVKFKKPLNCKVFRVTVATSLLRANCSPREVMDMLGHSDLASLEYYLAIVKKDLKKTHKKALDKKLPKTDVRYSG